MIATLKPDVLKLLPNRHAWTRAEFERIATLGAFGDQKVELVEGEIVEKMTQHTPHAISVYRVHEAMRPVFGTVDFMVRSQMPLNLGAYSQPEPDVAVVAGNWQEYTEHHPESAVLVVEVSDSSLDTDRTIKASLYAREDIADYWIVNVQDRTVEVHRAPVEDPAAPLGWGYGSVQVLSDSQCISPLAAPDRMIQVSELLP